MKILERIDGPFGGIDEQAMTEQLEAIISPDRAFRLMRIFDGPPRPSEEVFRRKAKENGYTEREIDAFIDYKSVI